MGRVLTVQTRSFRPVRAAYVYYRGPLYSSTRAGALRNGQEGPPGVHRGRRSLSSLIPYTPPDLRLDRNSSISGRNIERRR